KRTLYLLAVAIVEKGIFLGWLALPSVWEKFQTLDSLTVTLLFLINFLFFRMAHTLYRRFRSFGSGDWDLRTELQNDLFSPSALYGLVAYNGPALLGILVSSFPGYDALLIAIAFQFAWDLYATMKLDQTRREEEIERSTESAPVENRQSPARAEP